MYTKKSGLPLCGTFKQLLWPFISVSSSFNDFDAYFKALILVHTVKYSWLTASPPEFWLFVQTMLNVEWWHIKKTRNDFVSFYFLRFVLVPIKHKFQ